MADETSKTAIYGNVKIQGDHAARLRREAAARKLSLPALITEYTLRGLETQGPEDDALNGVEKRIVSSILATRSDIESLTAEVDTLAAMFDTIVKLLLVHLPEPVIDEKEAITASALGRYEKFLTQVAETGFDQDRPRAIARIAQLLDRPAHPVEND
jgi:hypothetical protein